MSQTWLELLKKVYIYGKPVGNTIELANNTVVFNPMDPRDRFCDIQQCGFNEAKFYGMLAWYLRGNMNDKAILSYFPNYKSIMNKKKPFFNSNYGYYVFVQGQIYSCISKLRDDINTRHACILINNERAMHSNDTDKLCTNTISFMIREGKLNMYVNMRSNDILGLMMYDVAFFCTLYEFVFKSLSTVYNLEVGTYEHTAMSMHIYINDMQKLIRVIATNGLYRIRRRIIDFDLFEFSNIGLLERAISKPSKNISVFDSVRKHVSGKYSANVFGLLYRYINAL